MHVYALKKISGYLKLTRNRGLILNPNRELFNIDSYLDADFSGMYRHENLDDTSFANSCTSYIIKILDCPVLWPPKLQTETSLLTTEAEIFDIAQNYRELFPVIDMTKYIGKSVKLTIG